MFQINRRDKKCVIIIRGGGGTAIYFAELVSKESSTYEENSLFKVDIVALAMRTMWHMTCCT